ncbi:MAG: hypothetical protein GEU95_00985 [Rhizobiales bacterium]|nr:hypothetical protein [Hyphomicrobiales bacterium]
MPGWSDPDRDYDYDDGYWDDPPEPDYENCTHEDYSEFDVLCGRVQCDRCGEVFSLTSEQIARDAQHQREYDRAMRRELWRDRWQRLVAIFVPWRRRKPPSIDDEVPF